MTYTESGYDPNDGLPEGAWVASTWGVRKFVPTSPFDHPRSLTNQCHACEAEVSSRAYYCRACAEKRRRYAKRQHMAKVRSAA